MAQVFESEALMSMTLRDLPSVKLCVFWMLLLAVVGCGTEEKLREIQIGMPQERVIKVAGDPKAKLIDHKAGLEIWIYPTIWGAAVAPQVAFDSTTKLVVSVTLNDGG